MSLPGVRGHNDAATLIPHTRDGTSRVSAGKVRPDIAVFAQARNRSNSENTLTLIAQAIRFKRRQINLAARTVSVQWLSDVSNIPSELNQATTTTTNTRKSFLPIHYQFSSVLR
jgi:hypothetical protein